MRSGGFYVSSIKDVLFDQISLGHTRNCPIHFINSSTQDLCMISDLLITVRNAWSRGCLVPGGLLLGGAWSWEGLLPGGYLVQGVPGPGGCLVQGGLVSQHALRQTPPGETPTAADGTHPTGMHSCFT